MGSTQSISFNKNMNEVTQSSFMDQLSYIQTATIPYIGPVQIYRFKQPPYDYIMKHKRVFQYNDPALRILKKNLQLAGKQLSHKNIAQVHYYKNNTHFHMCGKTSQIEIYCNFYTITLEQIIKKRRKDDIRFTSNQIWYVLKNLLEISVILRQNQYNFGGYRSKNITLSSEGYIKMYILHFNKNFHNDSGQVLNEYTDALYDRVNIYDHLPIPPEYITSIKEGNLDFHHNYQKQDSFMIATVVLQMMIDQDIRKYFSLSSQNFCTFKKSSIWKDLGVLSSIYDKDYLICLLQKMLCDDSAKRISIKSALQFINQNRDHINIGGSLRMFQDDQNHIRPKISYRTSFDFESNVLKTIQPNVLQCKLTACPIKSISRKGNNSKLLGVSLTSSKKSIQTKDKSLNKSRAIKSIQSRGSSLSTRVGNKL